MTAADPAGKAVPVRVMRNELMTARAQLAEAARRVDAVLELIDKALGQ